MTPKELAEKLLHTRDDLDGVLNECGISYEEIPYDFFTALDDLVLQCSLCGTWEVSDECVMGDDVVCNDCAGVD